VNKIQFSWFGVKYRDIFLYITQFQASFINNLIDNAFYAVSDNQWANYWKHVEHIEQETWKADNLQDNVGSLTAQLAGSYSSSSTIGSDSQDSVDITLVAPLH
jgi:hypothetical protein